MADCKDRVEAEYEAIENTLSFLPDKPISRLSKLELAGLATLIHIFFNGVECIYIWIGICCVGAYKRKKSNFKNFTEITICSNTNF